MLHCTSSGTNIQLYFGISKGLKNSPYRKDLPPSCPTNSCSGNIGLRCNFTSSESSFSQPDSYILKRDLHENKSWSSKYDTLSNSSKEIKEFNSEVQSRFGDTNVNNVCLSTFEKVWDSSIERFSSNSKHSTVFFKSSSFNDGSVKENLLSSSIEDLSADNSQAKPAEKYSPGNSLKFTCLKCGSQFPCTPFLCRKVKLSDSQESDSVNKNFYPEDHTSGLKRKVSDSSESTFQLQHSIFSPRSNSENLQSTCLVSDQSNFYLNNTHFEKNKMQYKNDSNKLSANFTLSKSINSNPSIKDTFSTEHDLKTKDGYDSIHVCASDVLSFGNSCNKSIINEKQPSDIPIESLSQGTRNFLKELAASNAAKTFSDSVSGYALSTINSPFSSKRRKSDVCDSNDNGTVSDDHNVSVPDNSSISKSNDKISMSDGEVIFVSDDGGVSNNIAISISDDEQMTNDGSVNECITISKDCIDTDNKEVTNALELIEQSSLHDRNLSSAEICNSLNQIFSEANMALSASAVSDVECSQAKTNGNDYETITLQTVESNVSHSENTMAGTINLADLCSGDNSEVWQQVLLVQDESGNIETVLLIPDDAQVVETLPSSELSNAEFAPLLNNVESTETSYISMNKISDVVQNALKTQNILSNSENNLVIEVSAGEHQFETVMEDSIEKTEELISENKLIDISKVEETVKSCSTSTEHSDHCDDILMEQKVLITKEVTVPETVTNNNSNNNENLSPKLVSVNLENTQQTSSSSINVQCIDNIELKLDKEISESFLKTDISPNKGNLSPLKQSEDLEDCCEILNEFKGKFLINTVSKKYDDNSNLKKNSVDIKQNTSSDISKSDFLNCVKFSSKAKKRCSVGTSNLESNSNQNASSSLHDISISDSSVVTPVNGALFHPKSDCIIIQKDHNSNSTSLGQINKMEQFNKYVQKSKKTFVHKLANRSAKKSLSNSKVTGSLLKCSESNLSQICNLSDSSDSLRKILNYKGYARLKSMLKRQLLEKKVIESTSNHPKDNQLKSTFNDEIISDFNGISKFKARSVALKTFIKPFTAAKKSIFDAKETPRKLNTALKTCVPKPSLLKTALKSFSRSQATVSEQSVTKGNDFSEIDHQKNVYLTQTQVNNHVSSKAYFQPEICEIRILPNDYVKRASHLLLKGSATEHASTPEENVSDEDTKLPSECTSPLKDLVELKFHCSCTAKEVPCLCYDNNLRVTCEAEDTFDDKIVPCTNHVSQHYLLTPSSEIKHRAFCDNHLWRLHQHHCCPKCGVFCSQGEFLLCSYEDSEKKENHLFHTQCFIVPSPGLPPGCPHCCKFSNFTPVKLVYRSDEQKEVPADAQNITNQISNCGVFLTVKQDVDTEKPVDSKIYVPRKNAVQQMIASLAKENVFRLRPTGKCLYNPIKTGDIQKVMQLIGNGVNPNHKFKMHRNNAPLHVAAHYGWTGILHILLQAGALIDAVNDDLETPLIVAVEKNQLPIVRYLVLAGAQIDVKDCNGMSSFHIASKNGFKEIAEFLYNTGMIDINLQDDGEWTALVWACEHKHVDFVKWLLEIGADPNVRDNEENTVLHWAAYSGKCEIAELLLEKGCTLSYVNKRGDSALHIAAREDNYECVKLFINRGAVLDQKNKENKTPLMCCQDDSISFNYLCQSISSGALKIGKLMLEKHVVFRDISRGAEAYPIQAVNDVDDEEFIMEFRYVVKQCHRSGVNIISTVDSMQFCYCKDNCITRDCNCTMNTECWYDSNGCLTSENDLQTSPVIFECNKTCHCPKTCINRVVQQGLRFPLQIFRTRYQGWGVRALQDIPKGAFVCEYVGELITGAEATKRNDDTYLFDLESQGSDYCLDGRYFGNVARFLNHSCEPNLIALKVFVDHQDMNFPRIAFFARKEIRAFEELCFDYGLDFWLVKCQTILCTCNTPSCKYSKDAIDDTLWRFFMDTDN